MPRARRRTLSALGAQALLMAACVSAGTFDATAPAGFEVVWPVGADPSAVERGAPGVLLVVGCGGASIVEGRSHYRDVATELARLGYATMVVDYVRAHGRRRACGEHPSSEEVVRYLELSWERMAGFPRTDATRLFLMGWSRGGTAVLDFLGTSPYAAEVRGAVLWYPDCRRLLPPLSAPPTAPTLWLFAGDDNVAPPDPCTPLVERWGDAAQTHTFPGAHHGFDMPELDPGIDAREYILFGPERTLRYDSVAAATAWEAAERFLRSGSGGP
ncbi:MAG: dienelactone hydrolase family protein [Gemmatimonadetes bacterium]|nr:dienelactone hydrolase family protein [Gemmatimonadota bacterium]